jgi:hypothetical protein
MTSVLIAGGKSGRVVIRDSRIACQMMKTTGCKVSTFTFI